MAETPADDRTLRGDTTPFSASGHHINVAQAEAQFNELQRTLSIRSQQEALSENSDAVNEKDIEKGEKREGGFDLRAYLTSSNEDAERAGLSHKHVGVTWENLEVEGFGGEGHKVCTGYTGHTF